MKAFNRFSLTCVIILSSVLNSCEKDLDTGIVTDIDGNIYHSVKIGTQTWIVENLKTTKYRNGDLIGTTTTPTLDISSESTPKYQWAYDGNENNVATYGRLYTGYTVTDSRNICPIGWHVVTDSEWTILTDYLGGEDVAANKLKEIGSTHWTPYNEEATNTSGFTALPGGYREPVGIFGGITGYGYWWSATEFDASNEWVRIMNSIGGVVERGYWTKNYGWSVRCIKDN